MIESTETEVMRRGKSQLCTTAFVVGIVSIFINFLGIIPLAGIIISIIALVKYDKTKHNNLWMGITGLILSVLYMLVNAYNNGHLG